MAAKKPAQEGLRDRIRNRPRKGDLVEVKEWGETVEVRSMTVAEKDEFMETLIGGELKNTLPSVVILTCHDPETGERLFTEDDREWLAEDSAGALEEVAAAGMEKSGFNLTAALESGKGAS